MKINLKKIAFMIVTLLPTHYATGMNTQSLELTDPCTPHLVTIEEQAIHRCLIHSKEECQNLFTYSKLKKHYTSVIEKKKLPTHCLVPTCKKRITWKPEERMLPHLILVHHKIPYNCTFPKCKNNKFAFQWEFESHIEKHKKYISKKGIFCCPKCQKEICSPKDLITIFKHYMPCKNGVIQQEASEEPAQSHEIESSGNPQPNNTDDSQLFSKEVFEILNKLNPSDYGVK